MRRAFLLITLCACGDNLDPDIRGPHRTYVVSRQLMPASNAEAREYGLDLDGHSSDPYGAVDNQMGMVLSTLMGMGAEVQSTTDRLVDRGELLQLIDLQTPDVRDVSAAAGFAVQFGASSTPPPCSDADDTVCRGHLQGNAIFELDPSSPPRSPLLTLRDETSYVGGPGPLSILVGFFGTPVRLDLVGARVTFVESQDTLTGVIGGGVTKHDIEERLFPSLAVLATAIAQRDCTLMDTPPVCSCLPDSSGKTLTGLLDTSPKDCMITVDEITKNSFVVSLAASDIFIDDMPVLSFGFRFEAVPAQLTP